MSLPAIEFTRVVKSYGRHRVLSEVDLSVGQGEFMGLVGVNGAGKTTMIKCLLDFTAFDSGAIRINGIGNHDRESRRRLAYLPEKFQAPYYLTGEEFLDYTARLYDVSLTQEKIFRVATLLDLDTGALKRPTRKYSKGMAQKLGIAACLLSDKEVLIMDEPMSGLDPRARAFFKQHLVELKQAGRTVFFSSHLLSDIEQLCDRVAILHGGGIRYCGTPAGCCERFRSEDFEQAYLNCVYGAGD